jgi:Icc-related predicted phosphoesterase
LTHQGFQVFKTLMEKYEPRYFLHGHMHKQYGRNHSVIDVYQNTCVINAYERYVFDYETEDKEKQSAL